MTSWCLMKLVKKAVNKFQDFVWDMVVMPVADLFKLECDYCWWWRGVLVGSIITSIMFILFS